VGEGGQPAPPGAQDASAEARRQFVLRLLADGELHSGAELAAHLGVTRAAVWKILRAAVDELGLELSSIRGKGYMLAAPLELLDPVRIEAGLSDLSCGLLGGLEVLDSVSSTNTRLMRRARDGAPSGLVCLAERQLAGRGRSGRRWVSPFGSNIYLSVLWRYPLAPAELGGLSIACGVAAARALKAAGVADIGLKWPNDLHWRRRKLGGLLLEVAGESQGPSHVVVGIGVNSRLSPGQAAGIDQPWTDLASALSDAPDDGRGDVRPGRNAVAALLIDALFPALIEFGNAGLDPFLPDWRAFDTYLGEPVALIMGERRITGTCAGVGADGALLLDTGEGRRAFHAGEVSLRPIATEMGQVSAATPKSSGS
jgi:BirA family biotin operon repressor/biotin-[acetyl-CoA-carboxylase] ligase